ncbi:ABC transporter G family member 28-like [Capsicum annuum]|uniref:ABC transporter G family member 28-like n=1 Tax=Capsicum annuum TaxID=4072 RepID=UPI001FB17E6E|nr:ABC transporter G family member 28-like [Capsicum annuum]
MKAVLLCSAFCRLFFRDKGSNKCNLTFPRRKPWKLVKLLPCDQEVTGSSRRNSPLQKCKINYTTGESASGTSSLAYFVAKDKIDHINTIVQPAVYLSMFYFFSDPRSSSLDNYLVLLCVVHCVTGIAYALAIYFEPGQAQLWSVLLPVVLTLVASKDSAFMSIVGDYIYSKWALEAFIIANAKRYSGVWLITRCGVLMKRGFALDHWYPSLLKLILLGVISRCVAFLLLKLSRKNKTSLLLS